MVGEEKMKSILITGAAGYIGSNLVKKLLRCHYKVCVVLRKETDACALLDSWRNISVYYDEATIQDFAEFMLQKEVDCVVHLATHYITYHKVDDIDRMLDSNIRFGTRLLEAMKIANINKIIYSRTSWQHYQDELFNPVNLYASMKQAFEDIMKYYTQAEGFYSTTLEIYDTYGEYDPRNKIVNMMKQCNITKEWLNLSPGGQKLDYLYIEDVVDAFLASIYNLETQKEKETEYALKSDTLHSLKEVVETFEVVYNTKLNVEWGKYDYRPREVFIPYRGIPSLASWKAKYSLYEGFCQMRKREMEVKK